MAGPDQFTLDVDTAEIGAFRTHVTSLADDLRRVGERAASTPSRPAVAEWDGGAASSVKPEMVSLGNLLCTLSNDLVDLGGAVTTVIAEIDSAETELAGLNRSWRAADSTYDDAVDRAGRAQRDALEDASEADGGLSDGAERRIRGGHSGALRTAYEDREDTRRGLEADVAELRERVAQAVRTLGSRLTATTPIEVPEIALAEWQSDGTTPTYAFDPGLLLFGLTMTRDYLEETDPTAELELRLRQEGLLDEAPSGAYLTWLENAARNGVDPDVVVEIARDHELTPDSFAVLDDLEPVTDPDGKTFYLLPTDISAEDARRAVMLTYVLNAGTGYEEAGYPDGRDGEYVNDFEPTPYGSEEVQRILDRQEDNSWSYDEDVDFVHDNGGRMATTPNGMLMGLGGNWLQDRYSFSGGTAWGDIFMLNIDDPSDEEAADVVRQAIESGRSTFEGDDGGITHGDLDLDRLLHHEERHSRQWAEHGRFGWPWDPGFIPRYLAQGAANGGDPTEMGFEQDAGLADGGYE